jgi:hypothetical protein
MNEFCMVSVEELGQVEGGVTVDDVVKYIHKARQVLDAADDFVQKVAKILK